MAAVLDMLVGDPHWLPHPVRVMGHCIAWIDHGSRVICRGAVSLRIAGICLAAGLPIGTFFVTSAILEGAEGLAGWFGFVLSIGLASTTLAARDLWDHARAVDDPLQVGNLPAARRAISLMVGRDTAGLSESDVARAAIETVAESTTDGVIAPLFYLAIGGVPLALAYKAINTLDSMIGHRDARYIDFGWASARLDDVANWIPARVAAILLILGAGLMMLQPQRIYQGWRVFRRDGGKHPSPNSGRPEAAMAGILDVRLGGTNFYEGIQHDRPMLGSEGRQPEAGDIAAAMRVMATASVLGVFLAVGIRWGA